MSNKNLYALLVAVGDYSKINIANLDCFREDEQLMKTALIKGLKIEEDRIRCLEEDGKVSAKSVAAALANFSGMLTSADSLIIYFSGHGNRESVYLSDGELGLSKIIRYIDNMPAKNKILILDCCHSGMAETGNKNSISDKEDLASYVGYGTAIIASSPAGELSWVDRSLGHSVFTDIVASTLQDRRLIRKGRISLDDIISEIRRSLDRWNLKNCKGKQQIIFRANIGGTVYFDVEEYNPYRRLTIYRENKDYIIYDVKPLNILDMKRLCAFIILKDKKIIEELPRITKDVAKQVRYANIANSRKMEKRFKGRSAQVVWCYFGLDESDMIRSLYFAYTIWAENDEIAEKYHKESKYAQVQDGIYIFTNTSYELIREIQSTTLTADEYMKKVKELYTRMISKTEKFIADIREVENGTVSYGEVFTDYRTWIKDIYRYYFELTDLPCPPDNINAWSEKVLSLAGWVMDIALILKQTGPGGQITDNGEWIIRNALSRYNEDLEELLKLEEGLESAGCSGKKE